MIAAGSGLDAVGFVGLCHLGIFGVMIPLSALGARRSALGKGRSKKRYFAGVIGQQLGLTVISVAVAAWLGIPLAGGYRPTFGGVVLAGGIAAALGVDRHIWSDNQQVRRVEHLACLGHGFRYFFISF